MGGSEVIESSKWMMPAMLALVLVTSWLLVAEIPMFALKFKQWGWKGNEVKYSFIIFSAAVLGVMGITGFAVVIACYVALSVILNKTKG